MTDRHRNAHEEKIYQALIQQENVNPTTLTIKNQKFEFFALDYSASRFDRSKYYLQIDEKGAKKIIIVMDRDTASNGLGKWGIDLNSLHQNAQDHATLIQKIENLNPNHTGITIKRLSNVKDFEPLNANDFDYTYFPKPIQASEIEAEEDGVLDNNDFCIFIEGESQGNGITGRKRTAEEEAIYQALKQLEKQPYATIQKENELFYYIPTSMGEHSYSSFYLQINKNTGEKKMIKLSYRYQTSDDPSINESLMKIRTSNTTVNQTYTKVEDNQKTTITKYNSIQNFNLDDIIKPSIRASQDFEVVLENGLKETSDKACKVQPGREAITVKFGTSEKQWDKENFLSQIPHLNDTNERKPIYDFNELYANSTPMQVQFFTNYMNAIDAASTDYQKMTEAKLIRAYDFALKGDIPRMELLIAKEINERLMNNAWKNEQLLSYFKGHDGLGKVVPLYYPNLAKGQ